MLDESQEFEGWDEIFIHGKATSARALDLDVDYEPFISGAILSQGARSDSSHEDAFPSVGAALVSELDHLHGSTWFNTRTGHHDSRNA